MTYLYIEEKSNQLMAEQFNKTGTDFTTQLGSPNTNKLALRSHVFATKTFAEDCQ